MRPLKPARKYVTLLSLLAVCCLATVTKAQEEPRELVVFAGAGMRRPLVEIGNTFEQRHGIRVVYDFEGSGRLGNKILVGQRPDVFIPGSEKWAKILKEGGYIKDYVPIAYHTPVIITPKENSQVSSLIDFADKDHEIVLGDMKTAAIGRVSEAILQKACIDLSRVNVKARGLTVKQLVLWVEGNNAEASIVWQADANQSGKVRTILIPEEYNITARIDACRLTQDRAESSQFMHYLMSSESKDIFTKHGFQVVE
ncbi:MAG: molybdate ABC transporter substrate-binding protein [Thermodesulfobacteriota bacterium]|nr:molybdate ABC transporter substrate-binding protein [Thermodesulfobacteriota bacterium]